MGALFKGIKNILIGFTDCGKEINAGIVGQKEWKSQLLLNMVKLRYGDAAIFLDVASVINSYEISGGASLGATGQLHPSYQANASIGASGFYANRPTITYNPLSGDKFARSLMSPIPISLIGEQ